MDTELDPWHTRPSALRVLAELNRPIILLIASRSDADPRSVLTEIRALLGKGRPVRGRAGERIRVELRAYVKPLLEGVQLGETLLGVDATHKASRVGARGE